VHTLLQYRVIALKAVTYFVSRSKQCHQCGRIMLDIECLWVPLMHLNQMMFDTPQRLLRLVHLVRTSLATLYDCLFGVSAQSNQQTT